MDTVLKVNFNNYSTNEQSYIKPFRGGIYLAKLPIIENSNIQHGLRVVLCVSNELCNQNSSLFSIAPITSQKKRHLPTHVYAGRESGLLKDSIILCENVMTVDSKDLIDYKGTCPDYLMKQVDNALKVQLALDIKKGDEEMPIKKSNSMIKEKQKLELMKIVGAIDALNHLIYVAKINFIEAEQQRDMKLRELEEFCKVSDILFDYAKSKLKKY